MISPIKSNADLSMDLARRFAALAADEVLSYAEISTILGVSIQSKDAKEVARARMLISQARRKAAVILMVPVECEPTVGIRRLPLEVVHERTEPFIRRISRAARRHAEQLNTVDATKLPPAKQAGHARSLLITATIKQATDAGRQMLKAAAVVPQVNYAQTLLNQAKPS